MPHDANTFNSCGEMMSGLQDSFLLKLALQPVGDQSPISHRRFQSQSVDEIGPGV